jgi:hypothetical protein
MKTPDGTRAATATVEWGVLPHPPYSPHLALYNFHLWAPWRIHSKNVVLRTTTNWNKRTWGAPTLQQRALRNRHAASYAKVGKFC